MEHKTNLVLSGGGIKGISHIGALYAFEKLGCLETFKNFSASSVGGVILGLYIIGYSPVEIFDFIKLFDLSNLKNMSIWNIKQYGLDSGGKFVYVFKKMIRGKGLDENITLGQLYKLTAKKLILTTVCVETTELVWLSHETHPDLELYLAVRMTISMPGVYCPVKYKGKYYVDGGCLDNYPFSIFAKELDATVGILITNSKEDCKTIDNIEVYMAQVLKCLMTCMYTNMKKGAENCTVDICITGIGMTDYDISNEQKNELFLAGYEAVVAWVGAAGQK